MKVVVDSGSTKADWRVFDDEQVQPVSSIGLNPVFRTVDFIRDETYQAFSEASVNMEKPTMVHFYGAGCWDHLRKQKVADGLRQVFPNAKINVYHDLLGAARAVCGKEAGIACILGTGSNSCLYDGEEVTDNVTNLSYLLGDEGSGTHLGKKLIRAYFYRELPSDLVKPFDERFPGGTDAILNRIYGKETPNVYLASFTKFLSDHVDHIFVQRIIYHSFEEFIDRHVRKYKNHISLPVSFIGSIAYHFQHIMRVVLEERAMTIGQFIQKPIDNLVDFHRKNG